MLSVCLMNIQTTHIINRAPSWTPQIREINNSYKSYRVWEGLERIQEWDWGLGGG